MAKIIVKASFTKNTGYKNKYLDYIATRDGVEHNGFSSGDTTEKQNELIEGLLKENPELKDEQAYKEYLDKPSISTASSFIHDAFDKIMLDDSSSSIYVDYIATRPGVQKDDDLNHGLFDITGDADIQSIQKELKHHEGNLWKLIVSLPEGTDFTDRKEWESICKANAYKIAKVLGVEQKNFRWAAAYHNAHNPHIHLVYWSKNPSDLSFKKEDSLNRINRIKSMFAHSIYNEELNEIANLKNQIKSKLKDDVSQSISNAYRNAAVIIKSSTYLQNEYDLFNKLSKVVDAIDDSKSYEYQNTKAKHYINQSVKYIFSMNGIKQQFDKFLQVQLDYLNVYNDDEKALKKLEEYKRKLINPGKYDSKEFHNLVLKIAKDIKVSGLNDLNLYTHDLNATSTRVKAVELFLHNFDGSLDDEKMKSIATAKMTSISSLKQEVIESYMILRLIGTQGTLKDNLQATLMFMEKNGFEVTDSTEYGLINFLEKNASSPNYSENQINLLSMCSRVDVDSISEIENSLVVDEQINMLDKLGTTVDRDMHQSIESIIKSNFSVEELDPLGSTNVSQYKKAVYSLMVVNPELEQALKEKISNDCKHSGYSKAVIESIDMYKTNKEMYPESHKKLVLNKNGVRSIESILSKESNLASKIKTHAEYQKEISKISKYQLPNKSMYRMLGIINSPNEFKSSTKETMKEYANFYAAVHQQLDLKIIDKNMFFNLRNKLPEMEASTIRECVNETIAKYESNERFKIGNKYADSISKKLGMEFDSKQHIDPMVQKGLINVASTLFNSSMQSAYESDMNMQRAIRQSQRRKMSNKQEQKQSNKRKMKL